MKRIFIVIFVLSSTFLFAESNAELEKRLAEEEKKSSSVRIDKQEDNRDDIGDRKFQMNGYFLGKSGVTVEKKTNEVVDNQARIQLQLRHKVTNQASFYGSVDFFFSNLYREKTDPAFPNDSSSQASYEEIYRQNEDGFSASIKEAYIDVYAGFIDFRIGKQIIKWGAADSPSAQLNPNAIVCAPELEGAFLQQTEDLLFAVTALRATIYLGPFEFEGIVVPIFDPSPLPDPSGYWGYTSSRTTVDYMGAEVPIASQELNNTYPPQTAENCERGGRIGFELLGADMNFYYLFGREKVPQFHKTIVVNGEYDILGNTFTPQSADIKAETIYPKFHSAGYSLRGSIKILDLGYRGDVNYTFDRTFLRKDYEISDPDPALTTPPPFFQSTSITNVQKKIKGDQVSYNVGIDYNIPFIDISFHIDYYDKRILRLHSDKENGKEIDIEIEGEEKQQFIIPRLETDFLREKLFIRSYAVWDIRKQDIFIKPEIEIRPSDNCQLFLGMLIFVSDEEEEIESTQDLSLSPFSKKDLVYLWAKYSF